MLGTTVGQRSLQEIEGTMQEKHYTLTYQTSDRRISVEILFWDKLVPPIIVTVKCHDEEQYGRLYWNLAEVCEEEPFDLTRFSFADPQKKREANRQTREEGI